MLLYLIAIAVAVVCIAIMKKIDPGSFGLYIVYVAFILILLALVFCDINAW